MQIQRANRLIVAVAILANLIPSLSALAQPAAAPARAGGPQGPQVVSPEVSADHRITFRILAPKAGAVRLSGGDSAVGCVIGDIRGLLRGERLGQLRDLLLGLAGALL